MLNILSSSKILENSPQKFRRMVFLQGIAKNEYKNLIVERKCTRTGSRKEGEKG